MAKMLWSRRGRGTAPRVGSWRLQLAFSNIFIQQTIEIIGLSKQIYMSDLTALETRW